MEKNKKLLHPIESQLTFFFESNLPLINYLIRRYLHKTANPNLDDTVDELIQNIFLDFYKIIIEDESKIYEEDEARQLLHFISIKTVKKFIRDSQRGSSLIKATPKEIITYPFFDKELEVFEIMLITLDQLDPEKKDLLSLMIEGLSFDEIATKYSIKKPKLYRVLELFMEKFFSIWANTFERHQFFRDFLKSFFYKSPYLKLENEIRFILKLNRFLLYEDDHNNPEEFLHYLQRTIGPPLTNPPKYLIEKTEREPPNLSVTINTSFEESVSIGERHSITANILNDPGAIIPKEVDLTFFNFTINLTSNLELIGDWHKKLNFVLNRENQINKNVEFNFEVNEPGESKISVDCYYQQRWLRSLSFEFKALAIK